MARLFYPDAVSTAFANGELGLFVAQSIVLWTGGMKLWLTLSSDSISRPTANFIVLVTCLPAILVFCELYYRLVDLPSRWIAGRAYTWLMN